MKRIFKNYTRIIIKSGYDKAIIRMPPLQFHSASDEKESLLLVKTGSRGCLMIVTLHELSMQGWTGLQQGICGRGGVWAKDKGREVGCLENGE